MNWAQEHFYRNMHTFNVILKARQLGFSTFIMIYMLDSCLFNSHHKCGVITQKLPQAMDLFDNKVKFAWDRVPEWLKLIRSASSDNARELTWDNGAEIVVDTGFRGGTLSKLHVSELGKIAAKTPLVAKEIRTGAFPAVHLVDGGQIFVESTAEGQSGEFYDLVLRASAIKNPNAMQPKLFFYPWYMCPTYRIKPPKGYEFHQDWENYFATVPADLDDDQKYWYILKEDEQKKEMKREYPSTPKEAFEASVEGALWNEDVISRNRVFDCPELIRIIVSIDPATTNNKDSDETGIVVGGLATDGKAYILEDASDKYTPNGWARKACELYYKYGADRVVAETNQGGDMVESTLRNYDNDVSYKGVRASRGKYARAEPVAALYERNLVKHVGNFKGLEGQMTGWSPDDGGSPDRIDALTWLITELKLGSKTHGARIEVL